VNSRDFLRALIDAQGNARAVELLPGAFNHRLVLEHTFALRPLLAEVKGLPHEDQVSFIRSLALYEQTVGGIGSPTLLFHALPVVSDPDHDIFDWVLTNTTSYNHYANGAKSYKSLEHLESLRRGRSVATLERERQRAADAVLHRADTAGSNLFNAIRRGDIKAVEALLNQGASPETTNASGLTATAYANKLGRANIVELLLVHRDEL